MGLFGSGIKSVQRGEKSIAGGSASDTVTIAAVVLAKSFLSISCSGSTGGIDGARAYLTNTTTITLTKEETTYPRVVAWEVIEFY